MMRVLSIGLAIVIAAAGIADAQGTSGDSGQYVLTQPRHKAKVKKIDALTVKQKSPRVFNPKELSADRSVSRKKAPKAKGLCAPVGGSGKPRAC